MPTDVHQSPSQSLETILGNPFISAPVLFSVESSDGSLHVFSSFMGRPNAETTNQKKLAGSIVANPNAVGAIAQVIPTSGKVGKLNAQRLLLKACSPSYPEVRKTLDFYPIVQTTPTGGDAQMGNLGLRVADGLISPGRDLVQGDFVEIRLMVGPDSSVVADFSPSLSSRQIAGVGIAWGDVFDVAKKVLPVVAKSGYDIYRELAQEGTETPDSEQDILDVLGSVAQVAVPIAGTLLSFL